MLKQIKASFRSFRPFAWLTFALAAIAVVAQAEGAMGQFLAYDRTAIQAGEIWRLITGHFTHWSGDHLLWDVVMFVTLGAIVESRDRTGFIVTVLASAMSISAVLWFLQPTIDQYRGLSGIDSALFTHAVVILATDARRTGRRLVYRFMSLSVLGFGAKIAYELLTGSTLFVDSSGAGFTALPDVHMVGGIVGGTGAWIQGSRLQDRPVRPRYSPRTARM